MYALSIIGKGGQNMDKDRLVSAANAIYNGADVGEYHDEFETIISLIMNASDEAIAAAWLDVSTDTD
jgi:hypothetical protein